MIYQIGALKGFLEAEGMPLNHIKPHGALYGMAARMEEVAHAVCDAAECSGCRCSAWPAPCTRRSTRSAASPSSPSSMPTSTTTTTAA